MPEFGFCRLSHFVFPLVLILSGCAGSRNAEIPPDEQYGHRLSEETPSFRPTISITEPDSSVDYFLYPVVVDSVHVRPAPFPMDSTSRRSSVPVEVLVKGSFPDACSELHELEQNRYGHLVEVALLMRRPRGASCPGMILSYRYYFMLDGFYEPGAYTLKINDKAYPFVISPPED